MFCRNISADEVPFCLQHYESNKNITLDVRLKATLAVAKRVAGIPRFRALHDDDYLMDSIAEGHGTQFRTGMCAFLLFPDIRP